MSLCFSTRFIILPRFLFMKNLICIISSVIFLSSSTELHELFRLPLLLEHYSQHCSESHHLSFIDFLKIHYSANHPNDQDDDEDNQLPFKSTENLVHIDTGVPFSGEAEEKQNFPSVKKFIILFAEDVPVNRSSSIFRPPRLI